MIVETLQAGALALAAVGGAAGIRSWLMVGPERKKILAEAFRAGVDSTEVLNRAAIALLDPYLEQIKYLRAEIDDLRGELADARAEIGTLRAGLAP